MQHQNLHRAGDLPAVSPRKAHGLRAATVLLSLSLASSSYGREADAAPSVAMATEEDRKALFHELQHAKNPQELERVLELLKSAKDRWPDDEEIHIALATAYARDHNELWALRVLGEYQLRRPPACAAQTVEAWLRYQQAELDQAEEILQSPGCAAAPPEVKARRYLVLAQIAAERGRTAEAERELQRAAEQGAYYEEDGWLLEQLQQRYDPGRLPVLSWQVGLVAGWTSNGLSGTPADTEATGTEPSGLGELRLDVDWIHDARGMIRPTLGVAVHANQLTAASARDLSYQKFSLRPGVILGRVLPRLRVGYRGEALVLAGGDSYEEGPLWYTESHAGELELTAGPQFMAFITAGRRAFRERVRTRTEVEHGLIWARGIHRYVHAALGASARAYSAQHRAYDQVGISVLGNLQEEPFPNWQLRQQLSLSVDSYPGSAGYFPSADGAERQEWSSHLSASVGRRLGAGVTLAAEFGRSHRNSVADAYDFKELRATLRLTWASDFQALSRRVISAEHYAKLGWAGQGATDEPEQPNVRELLRQDEAVQRGSSCLK